MTSSTATSPLETTKAPSTSEYMENDHHIGKNVFLFRGKGLKSVTMVTLRV
jgi:hypothetical protein